MKGKVLGIAMVGCILVACMGNSEQIGQVKALQDRLEPVEARKDSMNDSLLNTMHQTITDHVDVLYRTLTPKKDSLDRPTSILVSDYARLRKKIGSSRSAYQKLERDLEYSNTQLTKLLTDLKNNKVKGGIEAFPEFYDSEKKAVDELEVNSERLLVAFRKINRDFDRWHPKMLHIVDSLENRNNPNR